MPFFKNLGMALRGNPSQLSMNPISRSLLVQQLLANSQSPQQGLVSPAGVANKALQGLLMRRQAREQSEAENTTSSRQQALAGALMRASQQAPEGDPAKAAEVEAAKRAALMISGGLPEDPLARAVLGAQAGQVFGSPDVERQNVQSTFVGDNGNLWIVRRDGSVQDTNRKVSENLQVRETPGGGLIAIESRSGVTREIVTPEEGAKQAAGRAGAERTATTQAETQERLRVELPQEFVKLGEEIRRNEEMLKRLEAGEFQTGPVAGRIPAVTTAQQEFEVFSGEDVVSKISAATFGQLSEGEREFLRSTVPSRDKTEEANMRIIRRRIAIVRRGQERLQERMEDANISLPSSQEPASGGWSIREVP